MDDVGGLGVRRRVVG